MGAACYTFEQLIRSLKAQCAQEEKTAAVQSDRNNIASTFKLVDIEATLQHIESSFGYFNRMYFTKQEVLTRRVVEAVRVKNARLNLADSLKAELVCTIGRYEQWNEILNHAVCIVQLLNLEKRFSFFEEDCRHVRYKAEAWAGSQVKKDPPTLRHMFKDPRNIMLSDGSVEKPPQRRKRDIKAVLADQKRLGGLAIKEIRAVNKLVRVEEPEVPPLAADVTYAGCRVPEALPVPVRQSIFDLGYTCQEIHIMKPELFRLRDMIGTTLMIWAGTSKVAWEYGRDHIHEFPDMRRYEYTRTAVRAAYFVASREESKVLDYFLANPATKQLFPELESIIRKNGRTRTQLQAEWEERITRLTLAFTSVKDMMEHLEKLVKIK